MTYNFTPEQLEEKAREIAAKVREILHKPLHQHLADKPERDYLNGEVLAILTSGQESQEFDITDGRNRYRPCPQCHAEYGMGLSISGKWSFVVCSQCQHQGPCGKTDKAAFDAWNAQSAAEPTSGPQQEPPSKFDISDGRNRYKPCPSCHAQYGMGLSSNSDKSICVLCTRCQHRGPSGNTDKDAFDAWNSQSEATVPAQSIEPQGKPEWYTQVKGFSRKDLEKHYCWAMDSLKVFRDKFGVEANCQALDEIDKLKAATPASGAAQGETLPQSFEPCRKASSLIAKSGPADVPCGLPNGHAGQCSPDYDHKFSKFQPAPVTPVKEYKHWPWCNGDRKVPAGEIGHGCCCFNEYVKSITQPVTPVGQSLKIQIQQLVGLPFDRECPDEIVLDAIRAQRHAIHVYQQADRRAK